MPATPPRQVQRTVLPFTTAVPGDYKAAVDWFLRSRQSNRAYGNSIPWLAVSYAGLGQTDQGKALMNEYRASRPFFSIARWNSLLPHLNPNVAEQRRRVAQLLRELGVPEGPVQTGSVK